VESSKKRINALKKKTTIYSTSNRHKDTKDENQSSKKILPADNFQTFSQFIQSTTELNDLIDTHNIKSKNGNNSYALIGLHSCGNLSNSIVNLYLNKNNSTNSKESNNQISPCLLCNVACCYNLLNEKYSLDDEYLNDLKHTNIKIDDNSKFPMSSYLNHKKYYLNFNVRMLACHSLDSSLNELNSYKEVILMIIN
jgi:hypothetical protein